MADVERTERAPRARRAIRAISPRRRARRLWQYLLAERRTLRQGFFALLLGAIAALIAGVTLGSITETLQRLPGLIILIPAVLSMRGTIFGAMGARLGTATHAGLFEVTRDRGGVLYQNAYAVMMQTLSSSLYLAVLAKMAAIAFGQPSISIFDLMTIAVLGGLIDSTIILALTVRLSITSYRRGYDLDAVSTPIITAVADMTTVPVIFLVTFVVKVHWLSRGIGIAAILVCLYATVRGLLTRLPMARRIQVEMLATILLTPLLDILAGTILQARLDQFGVFPGLLILIPPFVGNAGSLGGIFASRLSSKIQLGVVTPRRLPGGPALLDAGLVMGFAIVVSVISGALALGYSVVAGQAYPGAMVMVGATLVAGILAVLEAFVISYYIAIGTARFGLDPDNQSVPFITSFMDLFGVATFLIVIGWFGVHLHG
jgi:mgtE-like transporter